MLKQVVKEGNYFNSLEEEVNEDIQKAIQEFRENQDGANLKDIAEKYNLNEIELELNRNSTVMAYLDTSAPTTT